MEEALAGSLSHELEENGLLAIRYCSEENRNDLCRPESYNKRSERIVADLDHNAKQRRAMTNNADLSYEKL